MNVFLDFEASSLSDDSYPIEVGWVFEDGRSETHLIRPAAHWTEWDGAAAAVHGITREMLHEQGTPHGIVANRLLETLSDHEVFASAPSWDGKWLSVLLRGAGLPRHAMRLKDTEQAHRAAISDALGAFVDPVQLDGLAKLIIDRALAELARQPVSHRALDDAERERQLWLRIGSLAASEAETLRAAGNPT